MAALTVYLVRHGETTENRAGIMQGHLDTALNAAGEEQARRTAGVLERVRFASAHSSDLARAVQTAEAILERHPGVALQTHAALRERYMGDMQGVAAAAWRGALPGNMEPAAAFVQRAERWWTEEVVRRGLASARVAAAAVQEGNSDSGGVGSAPSVLVVSHGGLLHVLLQQLIESRRLAVGKGVDVGRYRFANASVTVVELSADGRGTVVLFADTTHLEDELVAANVDIVEQAK